MSYSVTWQPAAENQLADLWLNAPDRDAITAAADRIDRLLSRDPANVGESRAGSRRVVIDSPLVVFYEVREAQQAVYVLRVTRLP
jgi:plasmid stabilization system protein ParE